MDNEMETGGIKGFKEFNFSYYIGETILTTIHVYIDIHTHYGSLM